MIYRDDPPEPTAVACGIFFGGVVILWAFETRSGETLRKRCK
jgi:hypothetical protein